MVTLLRGFSVLLLLASAPVAYFAATNGAQLDLDRDVASIRDVAETRLVAPGRAYLEASLQRRL